MKIYTQDDIQEMKQFVFELIVSFQKMEDDDFQEQVQKALNLLVGTVEHYYKQQSFFEKVQQFEEWKRLPEGKKDE